MTPSLLTAIKDCSLLSAIAFHIGENCPLPTDSSLPVMFSFGLNYPSWFNCALWIQSLHLCLFSPSSGFSPVGTYLMPKTEPQLLALALPAAESRKDLYTHSTKNLYIPVGRLLFLQQCSPTDSIALPRLFRILIICANTLYLSMVY